MVCADAHSALCKELLNRSRVVPFVTDVNELCLDLNVDAIDDSIADIWIALRYAVAMHVPNYCYLLGAL